MKKEREKEHCSNFECIKLENHHVHNLLESLLIYEKTIGLIELRNGIELKMNSRLGIQSPEFVSAE
jgi:hypothetical protein